MADLVYPLEINSIRGVSRHNAFGNVRNGGTRPHPGRDWAAEWIPPLSLASDR